MMIVASISMCRTAGSNSATLLLLLLLSHLIPSLGKVAAKVPASALGACLFINVVACLTQTLTWTNDQTVAVGPKRVLLREISRVDVPSLPADSIVAPLMCDPETGRIVFRMAMPETGVQDPLSVSSDEQTIVHFSREKINDIAHPLLITTFLSGPDLYVLTKGRTWLGYQTKWRTPKGDVQTEQDFNSTAFIAHFDKNGDYVGAVPLDIPFKPLQIGVFEDGDFLVAGAEVSTTEPRVAIVASNGQLRRMLELNGDVQEQKSNSSERIEGSAAPLRPGSSADGRSLSDFVFGSQIVRDGSNLLLFRPSATPIFSISPSGEVRSTRLTVDGSYSIYAVKPARDSWIVEFIHDAPNSPAKEFSTYAFDRNTGKALREYFFPSDLGWGFACTNGNQFTFVMADTEKNRLQLVTVAPTGN